MPFNFDQPFERRSVGSIKWNLYDPNVLPMWVADMDFPSPPAIIQALQQQVATGEFGYAKPSNELLETICARLDRLYQWKVTAEQIVFIPSLVTGIHAACRTVGEAGDGVLMQTPVYPPFLTAPASHDRVAQFAQLAVVERNGLIEYEIDFDAFEAAITENTRLFLLCNPHNPTGVAYSRADQLRMAEICAKHNIIICSDEIHCDLLLDDTKHIPMASIDPEIADRTITMMAPSKTFNVPGLKASFLVIPNAELRTRFVKRTEGIVPWVNNLGLIAMLAAYRDCDDWLNELRAYLTNNRNTYVNFIREQMPLLRATAPNSTYLGWIDCRGANLPGNPYKFFLEKARVALNDGTMFGPGGEGFVRLNFGCQHETLLDGLNKLKNVLDDL
ncbi:MAG: PatB family C-S lyase [Roseiflexaceae bacterium]